MQRNLLSKFQFLRQVCCLLLLLLSASVSQAQVKLLFDNVVYDGDSVAVDVVAYNFTNITGMQYTMEFDNELLTFAGINDFNLPGLNANSFAIRQMPDGEERLVLSWIDANTQGVTVPDGTTLYSLTFSQLSEFAGELRITGDPVAIEIIALENNQPSLVELNTCDFTLRPATFIGSVFNDINENCTLDADESSLAGWIATATNADGIVRYATSNSEGNFGFFLNSGDYDIVVNAPNDLWEGCENGTAVTIAEGEEVVSRAFAQKALTDCVLMEVSVSTPFCTSLF